MRRSFYLLLLAALLLMLVPATAGASVDASAISAQGYSIYVVRAGDTLYSIATRFCMTTQELYSLNSSILTNPNQIYPGMQLRVVNRCGGGGNNGGGGSSGGVCDRGPSAHAQGSVWGNKYLVVRGDTSYSVAARFGISVTALCQANGINPWYIFAGQSLIIPGLTGSCGQCGSGNWNCQPPPNNCQTGWNCPPTPCQWNCPPANCQTGWNCPPANCGWNCPVFTPVPMPTVVPVTPVPQARLQVTSPTPGQTLAQTFTVTGSGQGLFEGNVVVQAQNSVGGLLAQQATTLQGSNVGAGGPGTFSVQLTVPVSTPGFIVVFSPQSPVAPVKVPVTFTGSGSGGITYFTYAPGQCLVNVAAGQPFYNGVAGTPVGTFTFTGGYMATRGAKQQGGQQWYEIGPVATTTVPVWVPTSSTTSVSAGCAW